MAYPDKLLAEDEEVVRHLHPHWLTVSWPVVLFLLLVGGTSFAEAAVPAGRQQGVVRLVVLGVAVVLLLWLVVVPLLRWRSTHYVVTTHRLLFREGVLSHRGRDIGLSRITDVSYEQSLWGRLVGSGTVTIESAGEGGTTVLRRIPDSDGVQQVVNQLVEEDADRRARSTAGHARGWDGPSGSWTDTRTVGWDDTRTAGWDDRWDDGAGGRWDDRWDDPADEADEAPRRRRR